MGAPSRIETSQIPGGPAANDPTWTVVLAAARSAERFAAARKPARCALGSDGELHTEMAQAGELVLAWHPSGGWTCLLPESDPRRPLIDLYLPICSATAAHPITVGHLGQSLDGFIATHAGESQWVTGEENILHLHRLRALCDAVIVGAGTVAADDPLLTTRLVSGPSPLRVVLDPGRRLGAHHRVFNDPDAETLYVCAESRVASGEYRVGQAAIVGIPESAEGIPPADVLSLLRKRGCSRVFVEGGGVTVSLFLEANLLDRLHVAIAPLFIGDGRPAIRLEPRAALGDCHRPRSRVFRMGQDVLFDCAFGPPSPTDEPQPKDSSITRVI